MDRIWRPIVEPLLRLAGPETIVAVPSPAHPLDGRIRRFSRSAGATLHTFEATAAPDASGDAGWEHDAVSLQSASVFGLLGATPEVVLVDGVDAWRRALGDLRILAARSMNAGQGSFPLVIVWDSVRLEAAAIETGPDREPSVDLPQDPLPEMVKFVNESKAAVDLVDVPHVDGLGIVYSPTLNEGAPALGELITALRSESVVGDLLELGDALRAETAKFQRAHARYERLRSRRAVRLALRLAAAMRPLVRFSRRLRGQKLEPRQPRPLPAGKGQPTGTTLDVEQPEPAVESAAQRRQPSRRDQAKLARRIARLRPGSDRVSGPGVSIMVLTRDGAEHLERLLPALDKTTYRSFEVIVVDNGSSDRTSEILEIGRSYPLRVIRNEGNASFSEGNNQAARIAEGDYLLLLNNDIEPIAPGWLGAMVDTLEGDADAGACGAVLVLPVRGDPATDLTVQHSGIHFAFSRVGVRGVNTAAVDPFDAGLAGVREVPAATAAVLLVSRHDYEAVAGLDERYVYGTEDVDLCLKLRAAGRKIVVTGESVLFHHESATQNRVGGDIVRINRSGNRQRLMETWGPRLTRSVRRDRLTGSGRWTGPRQRTVAITMTQDEISKGWGDYYTAHELGDVFAGHGWNVVYAERYKDHWYELGEEVDLVIGLLDSYDVRNAPPGAVTIGWVRNWVDRWLERPWFENYDLVVTSSHKAASLIAERSRFDPPVVPLATNPERFVPAPPNPTFECDYAFTGNNWGHGRDLIPMLDVHPGEKFLLFGKGWDQDPRMGRYWRGHLEYGLLPDLYRSTKILLDDTAGPTLPYAFLNGRVFDGLAAGALVLTDNVEGSSEMFDGLLPTYRNGEELREQLDRYLSDDAARGELVDQLRRRVLENHTYESRPEQFLALALDDVQRPKLAIRIGVPDEASKPHWGDTHFANALAAALTRQGMPARVDILPEWDLPQNQDVDVVIHIRGLTTYAPKPAHVNVLWIISHPDAVSTRECEKYDLVLVASQQHARWLEARIDTPVVFMPQATDQRRFHQVPSDPELASRVLFVGNTRGQSRPVVEWGVSCGLPLTVYGQGWDGRLPVGVLRDHYFPNERLATLYSSSDVVLNDHWPDMRDAGFISNRVFDALACGTVVVSDPVRGLSELFGDLVPTYEDRAELETVVRALLEDGDRRSAIGEAGAELVASKHTFAHRAKEIVALVEPLLRARDSDVEHTGFQVASSQKAVDLI